MSRELFIEDVSVPLGDQVIGITLQLNNLAELNDRQSNYSNTLQLIRTPELFQAIGNYDEIGEVNEKPYRLLQCRYIQNGKDLVPDGVLEIRNSGKEVSAVIRSGNFEFFSKIKGLKIEDLDLSEYDYEMSLFHIMSLMNKTSGLVYPILQYGAVTGISNVDMRYQHHAIYVHSLIDKIVSEQGFTRTGTIWEDPLYLRMILPFCENTLEGENYDQTRMEVSNSTHVITDEDSITIQFDVPTYNQGQYNPGTGRYTFDKNNTGIFRIEGEFTGGGISFDNAQLAIWSSIKGRVATVKQDVSIASPGYVPMSLSTDELSWVSGEQVWAVLDADGTLPVVIMKAGGKFVFEPPTEANMNDDILMSKNAPDIGQTDLMKVVANMFGLFFQVSHNNLHAFSFSEIISNKPFARDWSAKLDLSEHPHVSTRIGSYGQINYIRYAEDTAEGFGDGSFTIDDETLQTEKTVITFSVSASETANVAGVPMAIIPRYTLEESGYEKTDNARQRILLAKPTNIDGGIVLSDGVATVGYNDTFFTGMFEVPGGAEDLTMNKLISTRYPGFVNSMQRLKVIKANFNLSESDLEDFDFAIPVWIRRWGSYFYVNKIENFREGRLTAVELIKL